MDVEWDGGVAHKLQDVVTESAKAAATGEWCMHGDIIYAQMELLDHSK